MNDAATANLSQADTRPHLDSRPKLPMLIVFLTIVVGGLGYALNALITDVNEANAGNLLNWAPVLLLGLALLIALGFEFVNGFHDTANAVATVIYTHSLPPNVAVVWSGLFNFFGVLTSSGAVAFGIISLLPVELILQVGSGAGFAMVFALLIAAILWNLGTWWLGLPASSSHTLIGSVIGVGIANALMRGKDGTSGVDWEQATKIGQTLLISPLIGFFAAALLLLVVKALVKNPALYRDPHGKTPPPLVDSRPADPDLYRGVVCPWLQRRSERHGPDHADPGRYGAHSPPRFPSCSMSGVLPSQRAGTSLTT